MPQLVTGATGNVGSLVVKGLLERGERPIVLARDPRRTFDLFGDRVEHRRGDLADPASLAAAFSGVERVFLVNAGPTLAERDAGAAQAAAAAGVRHLVKLSTLDVEANAIGTGVWHARGEAAIRESGVGFTFVRPSGFMVNALAWAAAIGAGEPVESASGEGRIAFIHPRDIAEVCVEALLAPTRHGPSLSITGPEALSYREMVGTIARALGRPIGYRAISEEEERGRWQERGETEESIGYHLSIFRAIREGALARVTDGVERALGRPPITFARWVEENLAAFEGGQGSGRDERMSGSTRVSAYGTS